MKKRVKGKWGNVRRGRRWLRLLGFLTNFTVESGLSSDIHLAGNHLIVL